MKNKLSFSLRRFNDFLTGIAVLLGVYILLMPLLPQFTFWVTAQTGVNAVKSIESKADPANFPDKSTLVIPKLNLETQIYEGESAKTLALGVWRRPQTSTPDIGGNTVLAGHRFAYREKTPFYHLDKMSQGDEIIVYWDKARYSYKVTAIKEVKPTAVEIEADTDEPLLTLYTCTPLWTSERRLVVQAQLMETAP
ncbi:MAG: sortase [Candidatus Saccharimonadales bacterium]